MKAVKVWLVDSGCGHDLVSKHGVQSLTKWIKRVPGGMVFQTANGPASTEDVVEIPIDRIEQPTATLEGAGDAVVGVYAAPDRLVHLLDPQRMIQSLVRPRPQHLDRQGVFHGRS